MRYRNATITERTLKPVLMQEWDSGWLAVRPRATEGWLEGEGEGSESCGCPTSIERGWCRGGREASRPLSTPLFTTPFVARSSMF